MAPSLLKLCALPLAASLLATAEASLPLPLKSRPRTAAAAAIDGALRRRAPFGVGLQNYYPGQEYYVTVEIGTPPQAVELTLDTGSSDMWVFAPGVCQYTERIGNCIGGTFDANASSTFELVEQGGFETEYADHSSAQGDYVRDTLSIGGQTVSNATFAIATNYSIVTHGILGISFDNREAVILNGEPSYQNLPDLLKDQGIIDVNAYSLYLDDAEAATGSILFGAYDTAKYTGNLTVIPLIPNPVFGVGEFAVPWTSLSITNGSGTFAFAANSIPSPAILDSGTTVMTLPTDVYKAVYTYLGFQLPDGQQNQPISCDFLWNVEGSLNFGFAGEGGPVIAVPLSDFAQPAYDSTTGVWATFQGEQVCELGFVDGGTVDESGVYLFGQTLLRSAYVLYDIDNKQLGIAQADVNESDSNIVEYTGRGGQTRLTTFTQTGAIPLPTTPTDPTLPQTSAPLVNTLTRPVPSGASEIVQGVAAYTTAAPTVQVDNDAFRAVGNFPSSFASLGPLTTAAAVSSSHSGSGNGAEAGLHHVSVKTTALAVLASLLGATVFGGMLIL